MGEHQLDKLGVTGSSPVPPTLMQILSHKIIIPMKKKASFFFLLLTVFSGSALAGDAPLSYVNQFPVTQWLNNPYYDTARVKDGVAVSVSHSSIYIKNSSVRYNLLLDFEITALNILGGKKIGENTEAGVFIPVAMYGSGFMDSFINGYHDTFGFPDYGRSKAPDNKFNYTFQKNGKAILNAENGRPFLGDASVYLKQSLYKSDKAATAVRVEAEFPTGDAKSGQGSGGYGFGLTVLNDFKAGDKFKLYIDAGIASPGNLRAETKIKTETFYHGAVAGEYALPFNGYSVIGQISGQTSPLKNTGIAEVDGPYAIFNIGLRKAVKDWSLELIFSEDLNTRGSPDFGITLTFRINK